MVKYNNKNIAVTQFGSSVPSLTLGKVENLDQAQVLPSVSSKQSHIQASVKSYRNGFNEYL